MSASDLRSGSNRLSVCEFVNAPAHRCSVHRGPLGERFVRYRGNDHVFIGLYLAPRPAEQPLAVLVLRRIGGERQRSFLPLGERGKWHWSRLYRPFGYALLIVVLLASPAWIGSGWHPSEPLTVNISPEAPSTVPGVRGGMHGGGISSDALEDRTPALPSGSATLATSRPTSSLRPHELNRPLPAYGSRARVAIRKTPARPYAVIFGDFEDLDQAEAVARFVRGKGYGAIVSPAADTVRVLGHRYPTLAAAIHMVEILRELGLPARVEVVNVTDA